MVLRFLRAGEVVLLEGRFLVTYWAYVFGGVFWSSFLCNLSSWVLGIFGFYRVCMVGVPSKGCVGFRLSLDVRSWIVCLTLVLVVYGLISSSGLLCVVVVNSEVLFFVFQLLFLPFLSPLFFYTYRGFEVFLMHECFSRRYVYLSGIACLCECVTPASGAHGDTTPARGAFEV